MSTAIDFDDEARKLFASLGLNKLGNGQVAGGKYNALDPIYRSAAALKAGGLPPDR